MLVSSTFHNNYSKGNGAYAEVLKIGHEHYRTDLLELMGREKVSAEEQKARLPNQTFRDRMTLHLGGKEIQILYVGRAHTRGDSIIFVPDDRIAYLSELYFADQFLFINDGYGLDWLRALDAVEALGADIFVPGHGPVPADPCETRQGLRRFRQLLVDVRDAFRKRLRAAQPRTRPLLPSDGRSIKTCRIRRATGNGGAAVVSATYGQASITRRRQLHSY